MKKGMKACLLMLCAVMLVTVSIVGTMAYLTSEEDITNTFTIGTVEITLEETIVDEYGDVKTGEEAGTTNEGQKYKLLPGHTYTKDPTITVKNGSEPCWLFVKVENGIEAYETTGSEKTIAAQLKDNGWKSAEGIENVYYHEVVDARENDQTVEVFESFTIADEADGVSGWDDINDTSTKVVVTAYAIQSDGMSGYMDAAEALGLVTVTSTP